MNYIYAALLLHSAGKPVTADAVKGVIAAAGEGPDEARIKALTAALEGVDIQAAIEKAAMPVAAVPAAGTVPAAAGSGKKEEVSAEEAEKKAEQAAEGLGSLFG